MNINVTILGAGPAGCALAAALIRQGVSSVCIVDHDSGRSEESFGESIVALTRNQIEAAGFRFIEEDHYRYQGNCSSWGNELLNFKDFSYKVKGGWKLNRQMFDATLRDDVRRMGVDIIAGYRLESLKRKQQKWELTLACTKDSVQFVSDMVVDASGRNSILGRWFDIERRAFDKLTCLATWVDEDIPRDNLLQEYSYVEAVPCGWWFINRVSEQKTLIALMTDSSLIREQCLNEPGVFARLLSETKRVLDYTRGPDNSPVIRQFSANSDRLMTVAGPGWLAVGDAAIGMDPLTSSGIACAFDDAEVAADLINKWLFHREDDILRSYCSHIDRAFLRYMNQRHVQYSYELRWQAEPFWSVRQHRIKQDVPIGR